MTERLSDWLRPARWAFWWRRRQQQISTSAHQPSGLAPLAGFRLLFGLLVLGATVRFWAHGWIEELYLRPRFFFPYYGFEWVRPLPAPWLYGVFGLLALSALGVALGAWYRLSALVLLLTFGYVELLDKTNYLNHYYYVTLAAALLCVLPAHRAWSVDAWRKGAAWVRTTVPAWMVGALKVQVGSVYFFGGVAKLKADWLLHAQPLKIWLAANTTTLPVVGPLLDDAWVAYAVAWLACLFDLTIPFLLWHRRTRAGAYAAVVVFHLLTARLFLIGIFPWAMMLSALVFFPADTWRRVLAFITPPQPLPLSGEGPASGSLEASTLLPAKGEGAGEWGLLRVAVAALFVFQLLMPLRFLLYPGDVSWHEQGFRYAWHIMLIEKAGTVDFHVRDPRTGRQWTVLPGKYLTRQQARMLATQPDMILQFAHYISRLEGHGRPLEVRAECYAALNGRPSQLLIDPTVDLVRQEDSFANKPWILPLRAVAPPPAFTFLGSR